ncbi:MAG: hypothetical protein HFJ50_08025 [Clostridia bacterium]|jgi:hypothetical protein|nr:hypothetical protein [Clostridia bacterium]
MGHSEEAERLKKDIDRELEKLKAKIDINTGSDEQNNEKENNKESEENKKTEEKLNRLEKIQEQGSLERKSDMEKLEQKKEGFNYNQRKELVRSYFTNYKFNYIIFITNL